jgi:hypothetical protein
MLHVPVGDAPIIIDIDNINAPIIIDIDNINEKSMKK